MRRTKIVATLGPATRSPDTIRKLLEAGANVFRLNYAHPSPELHRAAADEVREQAASLGQVAAVLADLPGPKMRTGPVANDEVPLEVGARFTLRGEDDETGDGNSVSTTVDNLHEMVDEGDEVFLADGAIILRVVSAAPGEVETEVVRRGLLRSRKGMHVPSAERQIDAFTDEDREALDHAIGSGVDLVGLSFVRDAEDLDRARAALPKRGVKPLLVAKIETKSAILNLDEVIRAADAVMVARGDLGIQLPYEQVPLLQKEIIRRCNRTGTPVVTATQMLESMTQSPLPSRAEVNDVANAVIDGTDALMLSEETAVGHFPCETVSAMSSIAEQTEQARGEEMRVVEHDEGDDRVSWAMARAAVQASDGLDVRAIVCPTRSGATALKVAAFRPKVPILALAQRPQVIRALALVWGVLPVTVDFDPEDASTPDGITRAAAAACSAGVAEAGDIVTIVAGGPGRRTGSTDFVRIVGV